MSGLMLVPRYYNCFSYSLSEKAKELLSKR